MKRKLLACLIAVALLTGCSGLSAVSGLLPTGKGVEATAQVGGENIKQGVGVSGKVDQSTKADTTVKDSKVESLDTSSGKKVSASSISAETIKADKIEIRNSDGGSAWSMAAAFFIAGIIAGAGVVTIYATRRKDKGA